jgi:hypothetical protein
VSDRILHTVYTTIQILNYVTKNNTIYGGTILRELRRTSTLISDLSAGAVEKGKERLRNRFAQTASSSPRQSLHLFSLRSAMSTQ